MSQLSAEQYRAMLDKAESHPAMHRDNITLPEGTGAGLSRLLIGIGAGGLLLTVLGAVAQNGTHALASYWVGVFVALSISLGGLFMVMVLHLTNAGWSSTIRRQLENLAALVPLCVGLMLPLLVIEIARGGVLLTWMDPELRDTFLIRHKAPYLNTPFFVLRFVICAGIWCFLAFRMNQLSLEQDRTGDRWLTAKARTISAWGMLLFALSVAFASFDWLMAMDYRFFSTIWGVYFFAGSAFASIAVTVIVLTVLRTGGRLTGTVTDEHFHDMGKLLFAFTVFWAYIGFSQYFLIWYSNIPEETFWFIHRREGGWEYLSNFLAVGHFLLPFLVLLFRRIKKGMFTLTAVAVWLLFMHVLDMVWIIRPMVYVHDLAEASPGPIGWWLDIVAVIGVLGIFSAFLVRRIASNPLVPLKDPRLTESLQHKNYI